MQSKNSTTLPTTQEEKSTLVTQIEKHIAKLQLQIKENIEDKKLVTKNQKGISILKLRVKLILRCGELSLLRLTHLQQVFKHYCTHVFRTGRYMTFQRLQYEKLHMTMQRFFIFLKDFNLIMAEVDDKQRQIIQKPAIITIFKKVSSNAREISFQEFIQCIQKLAILYWDEKEGFNKKQQLLHLQKQKRKKLLERRKRKKQGVKSQNSLQKDKNNQEENKQQNENEVVPPQQQKNINNQNDNLIDELMNNQNIEDPNEQVRQMAQMAKKENAIVNEVSKVQKQQQLALFKISNDQKIQSYYQLLDIDSIDSYKQKLTALDLPIYFIDRQANKQHAKALSQSKLQVAQLQQEERLQKLKAKMNQKKEKLKDRPLPKPSNQKALKQQQNSRRRKQMKKERQMAIKEVKVVQEKKKEVKQKNLPPKIQYKQAQVNWQMLQKITIDHLKLKQFNPSKFLAHSQDDHYFLQQYGGKPRISSRLQARERQSLSIVQSTKMRASQLQKKQRERQKGDTVKKVTKQVTSFSKNRI